MKHLLLLLLASCSAAPIVTTVIIEPTPDASSPETSTMPEASAPETDPPPPPIVDAGVDEPEAAPPPFTSCHFSKGYFIPSTTMPCGHGGGNMSDYFYVEQTGYRCDLGGVCQAGYTCYGADLSDVVQYGVCGP